MHGDSHGLPSPIPSVNAPPVGLIRAVLVINPFHCPAITAQLPFLIPPCYTRLMQSHELIREVLKSTSAKQIASDLNLSLSLVYKWAETPDPEALSQTYNPVERVDQLFQSTRDLRLIHWLCERAGGFFIRNPKTHHSHPDFLIPATNQIVQEFADLLAVVATAAADNSVTPAEARKIRARWEQLKTVTETFVHCCESGNFSELRNVPAPDRPPGAG